EGMVQTGKAIAVAALSTMIGFGSLSLSHYPGLRSMGLVAILGALTTSVVAITVLPAAFALRLKGWKGKEGP
ncbi:MAG: MMPL family transporter, partial [Thermoanaerobaculia bacterium]